MNEVLRPLVMRRPSSPLRLGSASPWSPCSAQAAEPTFDPSVRPEFSEPVTLASKDGVLEVRLIVKQGEARLDTVAKPVQNFLVFAYELIQGTASNGQMSGDNLYPAPTLQVFPGETLIVHVDNAHVAVSPSGISTIRNISAKGEEVPIYPNQMTESPFNLHVHGIHVSPKGNADNVMLHIPAGRSNTYTYHIPKSMPQGAYWYHSHLHMLTTSHVYYGLAGLLAIGRTDGNIPLVTEKQIPIRNMLLQYNYVFDREGGLAQLNNPNWAQYVSTLKGPEGDALAKGTYRPLLVPTNFLDSKKGTQYATIWYTGIADWNVGPWLHSRPARTIPFHPEQSAALHRQSRRRGQDVPADPVASRLQARRAVHDQRAVPAGHQEQGRTDRDLGALQYQRHGLHQRAADRDRDGQASQDRRHRPGRDSLWRGSVSSVGRRHPPRHSAGDPLRHRRHHARER